MIDMMRMGIDWGGTKIEAAILNLENDIIVRKTINTPNAYDECLKVVYELVTGLEKSHGPCKLGFGTPGSLSPRTGMMRNANSVWLNDRPLKNDLEDLFGREVKIANDANCFALSEAMDGAAQSYNVVCGLILGTGFGSGLVINKKLINGYHGIAGEIGHIPLANLKGGDEPGRCWCGQDNCHEIFVSGSGFQRTYKSLTGVKLRAQEIMALKAKGETAAKTTYNIYVDQLARVIALVSNMLDPDCFVLGGGMGQIAGLEQDVLKKLPDYLFSDYAEVPILKPRFGASSGVRGAAWLWND